MKQVYKIQGIIVIIAIIGLITISCDSGNNSNNDPCKDGHTFPAWTAPTCTVAGNSVRTCINCTQTDTRTTGFDALEHQGLTPGTATCTTSGISESGTCTREGCGEVITGTVIPALGHQGLKPAKAATCTTDGNESESGPCTRPGCGEVIIGTVIRTLGHEGLTSAFAATCTTPGNSKESGTCTRGGCGEVIIGTVILPLGHDFNWEMAGIKTCNRCPANPVIGDKGPAGGKIFYIALAGFTMTDDNSTAYYLEAAPANMATTLRWSTLTYEEYYASGSDNSLFIDISGTGTDIGTGRNNTALILAKDPTAPAALACINYTVEGCETFTDWFLPSRDELTQLYLERTYFGITFGLFFSSSQIDIFSVWIRLFPSSGPGQSGKANNDYVRAIRAF